MVDCRQTHSACSGVAGDVAQADTIFSSCVYPTLSKQPDASARRRKTIGKRTSCFFWESLCLSYVFVQLSQSGQSRVKYPLDSAIWGGNHFWTTNILHNLNVINRLHRKIYTPTATGPLNRLRYIINIKKNGMHTSAGQVFDLCVLSTSDRHQIS